MRGVLANLFVAHSPSYAEISDKVTLVSSSAGRSGVVVAASGPRSSFEVCLRLEGGEIPVFIALAVSRDPFVLTTTCPFIFFSSIQVPKVDNAAMPTTTSCVTHDGIRG